MKDYAIAQNVVFASLYGTQTEKVYCEKCCTCQVIVKERPSGSVDLSCGHIAFFDSDSGTWQVI